MYVEFSILELQKYTNKKHSVSHSVMSESLQPLESQHARTPCPSPTPRVYPNSCPLSWWCHPAISASDAFFSFCPQSFPASGTFPMSQLFASDDQDIGFLTSNWASLYSKKKKSYLNCFSYLPWTFYIPLPSMDHTLTGRGFIHSCPHH